MAVNTTSRWVWAYETTPRTSAIVDATSVTYDFGEYDDAIQKWQSPMIDNTLLPYYTYNKISPTLGKGRRKFETFHTIFNPTTPQFLVWQLGKCTDAAPDTIEPLDTGYQYPLTIRFEEGGGTETFQQAVSSWCVSTYVRCAAMDAVVVDLEWAFEQFEDHDDEPQLTTVPRSAGHTATVNAYNGMPTVTYDPDGTPDVVDWVVKAEFKITQNYTATLNGDDSAQTIYKRTFVPTELTLEGISSENTFWDHYIDRDVQDWEVAVYKPAVANYIKFKFVNAHIVKIIKSGEAFKGFYTSVLHLKAEEVTATFAREGTDTWADHFKGEVV